MTKENQILKLKNELEEVYNQIKSIGWLKFDGVNNEEHSKLWDEMVSKAVELHKHVNPKHHDYMIKNRGVSPDNPEFYNHIHPVEDLLAYIEDPTANDDPIDHTVGDEFSLKVYSLRWGHDEEYTLVRTDNGWKVSFMSQALSGSCDKKGYPYLYKNLDHDFINYPNQLSMYLERLWDLAKTEGLTHDEVQDYIDKISEWIIICEKSTSDINI